MSQTFANTIDGNKIYADRAEHDAAGNDIQTTYATKSEVPAAQVQADWSEADSSAVDFIKNKPANLVQDASYVHTDNNFTTALKDKLDGIASGAEVNVQADWAEADSAADSYIKNKPTIPAAPVQSNWNENDSSSLAYIQNKPSIPAAQVQSDWNQSDSSAVDYIKNKPTIPTVPVQDVEVDGTSVVNAQGVAEITMPTIPVTDVEVDGNSVVNAQGVAEITMPTFTQAQADWTESDTGDPSYIQNKPTVKPIAAGTNITITESLGNIVISASGGAAQQQADWNQTNSSAVDYIKNKPTIPAAQVQSNWAESNSGSVSFIQNKPAVLPVIAGSNITITQDSNGVTIASTASGSVTDVEVNGTSVVSGGVASITVPAQVQADWTESDNTDPSYIQNKPTLAAVATSGAYADLSGTPTLATVATTGDYDDLLNKPTIPAAPVQSNWNESDSASLAYIQNKPANIVQDASYVHTDNNFTTSLKDKLDGIASGAEVNVQANWTESDSNSDSYIQNKPTLAAVATSGAYSDLSGTPTINNVPDVTSSDDSKVLKATYSGGVGSYSWQTEQGGGSTYTAGDGIDITSDVISADVDGTTIGIDSSTKKIKLLSTIPSVDQTYSAASTNAQSGTAVAGALAGKEDAFDVGTGLEMDTSGDTPTLQVEAPVDIVAGPGIIIDNPDGNTLRVSQAYPTDETVLSNTTYLMSNNPTIILSEPAWNFEFVDIYALPHNTNAIPLVLRFKTGGLVSGDNGSITIQAHAGGGGIRLNNGLLSITASGNLLISEAKQFSIIGTTVSQGNAASSFVKVVGVHRIAGGN